VTDWRLEVDLAVEYDWRRHLSRFLNCDKQLYNGIYWQHFFYDLVLIA